MPDDILQGYKYLLYTSRDTYLINSGKIFFEKLHTTWSKRVSFNVQLALLLHSDRFA